MINIITLLLFILLIIDIPTMIAYLIGLKFQIKDTTCKDEVKNVKTNILMTKIIQIINVIGIFICLILIIIY